LLEADSLKGEKNPKAERGRRGTSKTKTWGRRRKIIGKQNGGGKGRRGGEGKKKGLRGPP